MIQVKRSWLVVSGLLSISASLGYYAFKVGLSRSPQVLEDYWEITIISMLVVMLGLVIYFWVRLKRSLQYILDQLQVSHEQQQIGMIKTQGGSELVELVQGINRHLTKSNLQYEQIRLQKREFAMQAETAESERQRVEAIIYSISEAVIVTDQKDNLLLANRTAEGLFGFRYQSKQNLPISDLLDDRELLQWIQQTRRNKSRRVMRMMQHRGKDQTKTCSYKVFLSCVIGHDKEVLGVVVVIHDITRDQEMSRMKDDFVNTVSHELKTPLASICAYAEMLTDNEANCEQTRKEFSQIIHQQGKQLNTLVEEILQASWVESGAANMKKEPHDLYGILDDVLVTLHPNAQEKKIEIRSDVLPDGLPVYGDRRLLYRAFLNLLSNALKYSPDQATVQIKSCRQDALGQVVIEIIDQGVGIPGESMKHIFEKFYRVKQNQSIAKGTGLGLNLVKKIICELHDGQITVASQVNKGSIFKVILPQPVTACLASRARN